MTEKQIRFRAEQVKRLRQCAHEIEKFDGCGFMLYLACTADMDGVYGERDWLAPLTMKHLMTALCFAASVTESPSGGLLP